MGSGEQADTEHAARAATSAVPSPGLHGPALWIAVGAVLGASIAVLFLAYFRMPEVGRITRPVASSSQEGQPPHAGDAASSGVGTQGSVARTIDLNTATQAELELLPGVGPTVAKRIIDYRTQRGRFRSVEELDRIKGIGPRMIEQVRGLVGVSGGDSR